MMIFLIIWISGIIPGYLSFKEQMYKECGWTVGDRRTGIFLAVCASWVNIAVWLIVRWVNCAENKPAKW
jgi:hypothetical protein